MSFSFDIHVRRVSNRLLLADCIFTWCISTKQKNGWKEPRGHPGEWTIVCLGVKMEGGDSSHAELHQAGHLTQLPWSSIFHNTIGTIGVAGKVLLPSSDTVHCPAHSVWLLMSVHFKNSTIISYFIDLRDSLHFFFQHNSSTRCSLIQCNISTSTKQIVAKFSIGTHGSARMNLTHFKPCLFLYCHHEDDICGFEWNMEPIRKMISSIVVPLLDLKILATNMVGKSRSS